MEGVDTSAAASDPSDSLTAAIAAVETVSPVSSRRVKSTSNKKASSGCFVKESSTTRLYEQDTDPAGRYSRCS